LSGLHHPGFYHFFFETLYDSSSWETFGSEGPRRATRLMDATSKGNASPLQKSQKGNTSSSHSNGSNSSSTSSSSGNAAKRSNKSSTPQLSTARRRKKNPNPEDDPNGVQRRCGHCLATETPMWRNGPPGFGDLCNKVGLSFI
jgi:hypothetical protein